MGKIVLVYGKSGSGKSRSLKNFAKDEIFLVNVTGKDLPFRTKFDYVKSTASIPTIINALKKMPTKTAVIDDAGYLMTETFMAGFTAPKKGASQFDLYNEIGDGMWKLIKATQTELPDDVLVYVTMHEQSNDYGDTKLRTIGKLLDEKVCLEGLSTICLRCMTDGTRHYFRTQSDGSDISKSPEDMFPSIEIDNDLKMVDTTIREYYGFNKGDK